MISNIVEELNGRIDPATLTIQLPDDIISLIGDDAQFEMVTSNTI